MSKNRVGILTFHYAHNYGAMLQAFATKSYLVENGYDVKIINYVPTYMELKYYHASLFKIFRTLKRSIVLGLIKRRKNIRRFKIFEKEELDVFPSRALKKSDLIEFSNAFDMLIFGSDQIWNIAITKGDSSYWGDFTDNVKKISFAASSGDALKNPEYTVCARNYLSSFTHISVRERDAQNFLYKLLNMKIDIVLDPVFLLDKDYWINQAHKSAINLKEDYVFYYTIQDNEMLSYECTEYAKAHNLKVFTAHGEMKNTNDYATMIDGVGPNEFLNLILHANTVFTNSFHATAFSVIFDKHAYICVHTDTGNRVVDLLSSCGCKWDGVGLFEKNEDIYSNLEDAISFSRDYLLNSIKE